MNEALQDYVAEISLREPDLLQELRSKTSELPLALMQISPEQGQFISLLVKAIGARRALEVGVFTGYSLLSTALALPEGGSVVALDISEEWSAMARDFAERAGGGGGGGRPPAPARPRPPPPRARGGGGAAGSVRDF
ncbi:hypothetical protein [Streptomyces sp. NPDC059479]|uniref:hypothetical protein n=1 Tax=Streptomyces sp. NPDC059479 TaxID=3346848 RepID=UPI00367CCB66